MFTWLDFPSQHQGPVEPLLPAAPSCRGPGSRSVGHCRCHRTGCHTAAQFLARGRSKSKTLERRPIHPNGQSRAVVSTRIASYRARRGPPGTRKWAASPGCLTGKKFFAAWQRKKAFALGFLTSEFAGPPHRFVLLPSRSFRRFLVEPSALKPVGSHVGAVFKYNRLHGSLRLPGQSGTWPASRGRCGHCAAGANRICGIEASGRSLSTKGEDEQGHERRFEE